MNRALAIHVIEELQKHGVEEFVLCPGTRNAPFILLLEKSNLKKHYWPEERSAAFFALGRARARQRPVAVITTSGTAAGELLAAMMEAYYTSVPLVAVTADRPRSYRNCNNPQTANQEGLYGIYAPLSFDLEGIEHCTLASWNHRTPVHLNVCFEEPAADEIPYPFAIHSEFKRKSFVNSDHKPLENFLKKALQPLVLISTLHPSDREGVLRFLMRLKAPVYAEPTSGLRGEECIIPYQVIEPDLKLHDSVLRIGGIPTVRLWRDLENRKGTIDVLSITDNPFAGLTYAPFVHTEIGPYLENYLGHFRALEIPLEFYDNQNWLLEELNTLLNEEPTSEPGLIHQLSQKLECHPLIFLGNSLPIRDWDLAAIRKPFQHMYASRGLAGIDGQISTFFGLADINRLNIGLFGDLTVLYDLVAPWGLQNEDFRSVLFIMNNHGGQIFNRRFQNPVMTNPHQLEFSSWAKFWNLPYQAWKEIPDQPDFKGCIELLPNEAATQRFRKKWAVTCKLAHEKVTVL